MDDVALQSPDGLWSLTRIAGITARAAVGLARTYPTAAALRDADPAEVAAAHGERTATALGRAGHQVHIQPAPTLPGTTLLTPFDPAWPALLEDAAAAPALLWAVGDVELLRAVPAVGVIGPRTPTVYGQRVAVAAAEAAVEAGQATISGAAAGIDQLAADATWAAGGRHIAFLGSGLDRPRDGADPVLQRAWSHTDTLALTEQPPGVEATGRTLVARSRLLVALSRPLVVAQAADRSGTAHTVRFAVQAGTPLVVPQPAGRHAAVPQSSLLVRLCTGDGLAAAIGAQGRLAATVASGGVDVTPVADRDGLVAAITTSAGA